MPISLPGTFNYKNSKNRYTEMIFIPQEVEASIASNPTVTLDINGKGEIISRIE